MDNHRERRRKKLEATGAPHPVAQWLEKFLLDGSAPQSFFMEILDTKVEGRINYQRGEDKTPSVHFLLDVSDPKITIANLVKELLAALPELKKGK